MTQMKMMDHAAPIAGLGIIDVDGKFWPTPDVPTDEPWRMSFDIINPPMAQHLLDNHQNIRPMRPSKVKAYYRDMLDGNWGLTPEGLILNADGTLMNGQHRCKAIILSNTQHVFAIYRYKQQVDPRGIPLDRGAPRSTADVYQLENRDAQLAARIGQLHTGVQPTAAETKRYYDAFESEIVALREACGGCAKNRTSAATKTAVIARMLGELPGVQAEILEQWRKFVLLDFDGMWTSIGSLVRSMDRHPLKGHWDVTNRTYTGFNTYRRSLSRISTKLQNSNIDEIRGVLHQHYQSRTSGTSNGTSDES